jgi:3-hydroxyisobutyrate dehydrogenase-like beta-hydroxyacid dehydrogenase
MLMSHGDKRHGAFRMKPVVAVIAPGMMGAGVAARLVENGVRVVTPLEGRSAASRERAKAAGMVGVGLSDVVRADIVLSILPPAQALPLAERIAAAARGASGKPLYVDCNAISPASALRIGAMLETAGCPFVDGGIIGGPPRPGYSPALYLSGPNAAAAAALAQYGLRTPVLDAGIGAASALKMAYGGVTKGLIALGAAMALGAARANVGDALRAEIAASQPALLVFLRKGVPDMFGKAYRWVAEMEEIAEFLGERSEGDIYAAIANLYLRLSDGSPSTGEEIADLAAFFAPRDESGETRTA